jgi:protein-tyrosine phosphatase
LKLNSTQYYEVIPGLIYAGECPWNMPMENSHLLALYGLGIRHFMTLREKLDLQNIALNLDTSFPGISIMQYPIRDFSVPSDTIIGEIIQKLKDHVKSDKPVYISCAKGLGRTGLVIASFLAEYHGKSGEESLEMLTRLRMRYQFQLESPSPETQEQIMYVINRKSQ